MTRRLKYPLILLAILGVLFAAAYWVLTTAEGARFFLGVISWATPVEVKAEKIQGRLIDRLEMESVQVRWPRGEAQIDSFFFEWRPVELRRRELLVREAVLSGVRVRDLRPETREIPRLSLPSPPSWTDWLRARAEIVRLEGLTYQRLDAPPLEVEKIFTRLSWQESVLTVRDFLVASPAGRAEGIAEVAFRHPRLNVDLIAHLAREIAGLDTFALSLHLNPRTGPERGEGTLILSAREEGSERLRMESHLAVEKNTLRIKDLLATQPGRRGSIHAQGEIVFARKTRVDLEVEFAHWDLERETGKATALFGKLEIRGFPEDYRGRLLLANRVEGWQALRLAAEFQGGRQGAEIRNLEGDWLEGTWKGKLQVRWGAVPSLGGNLQARGVNPAAFGSAWAGKINFNLQGKLERPGKEAPQGTVQVHILESTIRERGFKADMLLDLQKDFLHQGRVTLFFARERIQGVFAGSYREGVLEETVQTLRGDGAAGPWALTAPAKLRLSPRRFKLSPLLIASPQGEELSIAADLSFEPLRGGARAAWSAVNLARANPFLEGSELRGRTEGKGEVEWREGMRLNASAQLSGTYAQKDLQTKFSSDLRLAWNEKGLAAAAALHFDGRGRAEGKITSPEPARIGFPSRGKVEAGWEGIHLELFRPVLPPALALQGRLSGKLKGQWFPASSFILAGEAEILKGEAALDIQQRRVEAEIAKAQLSWDWRADRIRGRFDLGLKPYGLLKGRGELPVPARWPVKLEPGGKLQAAAEGRLEEKGLLAHLFPAALQKSRGTGYVRLHADGTWARPALKGEVQLAGVKLLIRPPGTGPERAAAPARVLDLSVPSGLVNAAWAEERLDLSFSLQLGQTGRVRGNVSAPGLVRLARPRQGEVETQWKGVDLEILRPLLPGPVALSGRSSGKVAGRWFSGELFDMDGEVEISQGSLGWQAKRGWVKAGLEEARMEIEWGGERAAGRFILALKDYGRAGGEFQIPLAARFRPAINPAGPLRISVTAQVQEKGLLAAFFPGTIQESRGGVRLEGRAAETWESPTFEGELHLRDVEVQGIAEGARSRAWKIEVPSGEFRFDWDRRDLRASAGLRLRGEEAFLRAAFTAPEPARWALPQTGTIRADWAGVDLRLLQPYVPEAILLEGQVSGNVDGRLLGRRSLAVAGKAEVSQGALSWRSETGLITAKVKEARLGFSWEKEAASGDLSLALAEYGWLKGSFRVHLPARLPPAIDPQGPVRASLEGKVRESGLLTAVFPGMVQESRGEFSLRVQAAGTWGRPDLSGEMNLAHAGAYLPALGIKLEAVAARVQFAGDEVHIRSLQARSGPGRIEGQAKVWLREWGVFRYEGTLRGERFQAVYLPEVRALASPKLEFSGDAQALKVRGEVVLPELFIYGRPPEVVEPSPDVIILEKEPEPGAPLRLDVRVRVVLGDRVFVRAEGLDIRLAGNVEIAASGWKKEEFTARGEVSIAEGSYSWYAIGLKITRGRFFFTGGPVDRPTIDILALRQVQDVQAGIIAAGDLQAPVVKLYSQPAMADTDILSYIVLGRPLSQGAGEANLLYLAAGALLSRAESVTLQDKIKTYFGIDTLDIESGGGEITRSMVTVGKYLSPKLYVSLGRSIFTNEYVVTMRYNITKRWEIETKRGVESGVDLFYKIEFD